MFAPMWMSVCLLACFLSRSVSQASEEWENVKSGDDVILHCQGPKDAAIEMLEWIKPDVKSDKNVFFFRELKSYKDYQHPDFHGRVELVDPEMKNGTFSAILKNVTINDVGTYECRVGKSHSGRSKHPIRKLINSVSVKVDSVWRGLEADSKDNITLSCPTLSTSPITAVMWTLRNKKDYVFLYRDKRSVPDIQHPGYKNWVELKDGEMKDGDASLILKDVMHFDSGTYECWVTQGGTSQRMNLVYLYVYPKGEGAGQTEDGEDKGGEW